MDLLPVLWTSEFYTPPMDGFVPVLWARGVLYLAYGWICNRPMDQLVLYLAYGWIWYLPYWPVSFIPRLWMDGFVPVLWASEFCTSPMDGFAPALWVSEFCT